MKYKKSDVDIYNRGGGEKRHNWTSKKNLQIIEVTNRLNKMIKDGEITYEEAVQKLKKMKL